MQRCVACHRPIARRWWKCPWCRQPSGQPRPRGAEALDNELRALVAMGAPMSLMLLGFGAAFLDGPPARLLVCWGLGAAMLAGSAGLLFCAPAYDVFLASWVLLAAAFISVATGPEPALAYPVLVSLVALGRRSPLRARIRGEEPRTGLRSGPDVDLARCSQCGAASQGLVAPVWLISFLAGSIETYGFFAPLCRKHARLWALPATVASALLGWWSFEGLLVTPFVLFRNLRDGGVTADAATRQEAEQHSRMGWRSAAPWLATVVGTLVGILCVLWLFTRLTG